MVRLRANFEFSISQQHLQLVLLTGLEPVRSRLRGILSPLCLPIPPQQRVILKNALANARAILEAPPRFELGMKLLQSSALPLGYGAMPSVTIYAAYSKSVTGAGDEIRTRDVHLGKVTLYH